MNRTRKLRIARVPLWSWRIRIITFVGIFGTCWLFLEPLGYFDITICSFKLSSLGIKGYIGLLVIVALVTFLVEYIKRIRAVGTISFTVLNIILTEDGVKIKTEVPQNMGVGQFIKFFLDEVSKDAPPKTALSRAYMYEHTLLVERKAEYVPVDSEKTISEAGLMNEDVCKIRQDEILSSFSRNPFLLISRYDISDYIFNLIRSVFGKRKK